MSDLIKVEFTKPEIPEHWDYNESVKKVKRIVYKAKNLTEEILGELYIAREILSSRYYRDGTNVPSWNEYCQEIGVEKRTVNRWLNPKSTVHIAQGTGENEWDTPPEFIQSARIVMGNIDVDPASNKEANETIQADRFYTVEDSGLDKKWDGNIWINPPYAQPLIVDFSKILVEKYESREIKQACVLVNNATETIWFQEMLKICKCVCFPKGRIKFIDKQGNPSGAPLQGQAILYFGKNEDLFSQEFSKYGLILWRK